MKTLLDWLTEEKTAACIIMRADHEPDELDKIARVGHFYRGMAEAEYMNTVGRGKGVESKKKFSLPGEGTSFSIDPQTAESYVNYGRDDPRHTGRPTYLVEVRAGKNIEKKSDGYYQAHSEVPHSQITRVWKIVPDFSNRLIGTQIYGA